MTAAGRRMTAAVLRECDVVSRPTATSTTTTPTNNSGVSPMRKSHQNRPKPTSARRANEPIPGDADSGMLDRRRRLGPGALEDGCRDPRRCAVKAMSATMARSDPGHDTWRPSPLQKVPKLTSISPTPIFMAFSGTPES